MLRDDQGREEHDRAVDLVSLALDDNLRAVKGPAWLPNMEKYRIYPYAWALWDILEGSMQHGKYLRLKKAQAEKLARRTASAMMNQQFVNVLRARVKFRKRYRGGWYCFFGGRLTKKDQVPCSLLRVQI